MNGQELVYRSEGLYSSRGRAFRHLLPQSLIAAGPAFHIGFLVYTIGADIIQTSYYAPLSMALPSAFLLVLVTLLAIPAINMKRRSARIAILIWAGFYFYATLTMPWQADRIFGITRLLVMSPWLVVPATSMIWTVMAYLGLTCYGLSITCVLFYEFKKGFNPYIKEHVKLFKRSQRVRFKGTISFVAAIILGVLMLTGNQMWYVQTFTLHYTPSTSNSVEYWYGPQDQYYNGTFSIISPSSGTDIKASDNVTIDLSALRAGPDPFYPYRFQFDITAAQIDQISIANMSYMGNYVNETMRTYGTRYSLAKDFSRLYLDSISASMATRLNQTSHGVRPLYMTCTGYYESRLQALNQTHACSVRGIPPNSSYDNSEFNATMWLFYTWGLHVEAPHGCGIGFLLDYDMLSKELMGWQDLREKGPYYYRQVIVGAMYDVERIDNSSGHVGNLVNAFTMPTYGLQYTGDKSSFTTYAWEMNTMSESEYDTLDAKWNVLIDKLYNGLENNGSSDPSLRFKLVNCGTQDNILDYYDGDPDIARFMHNLGYGTHFAIDGYMFYRSADEPYWLYGFLKALADKPKIVPDEERLVLLGCMNTNPYSPTYTIDPGSRFQLANGTWTQDVNQDGKVNGFDDLMLDIMMCNAMGIPHVNLWPGGGPRSGCCDWEQYPNMGQTGDFFTTMASVLSNPCSIQFNFLPGHEHYWDKVLEDNEMDLMTTKGLWVVVFFALIYLLFAFMMANNLFSIVRKSRDQ